MHITRIVGLLAFIRQSPHLPVKLAVGYRHTKYKKYSEISDAFFGSFSSQLYRR